MTPTGTPIARIDHRTFIASTVKKIYIVICLNALLKPPADNGFYMDREIVLLIVEGGMIFWYMMHTWPIAS